jgi:hypothetical protein
VIVDEEESQLRERVKSLAFSDDGRSFAYAARREGRWFCILDGVEQESYDQVDDVAFLPGSGKLVYLAARNGTWFSVIGGKEGTAYAGQAVGGLTISADGEHHAYGRLNADETVTMVLDGREVGTWDVVNSEVMPRFDERGILVYGAMHDATVFRVEVRPR